MNSEPFVSVLTPVYDGEAFLGECIESVLAQSYQNWEYQIVNNCSTDRTLEIAQSYAQKDHRIRVSTNSSFVGAIENHNIALRLASPLSRYCKIVSADDWIMPDCLTKMVQLGQAHPTVGIIGSYQRSGDLLRWQAVPREVNVMSGRDACRLALLQHAYIFGAPTAFLYRSDLVRMSKSFFPHTRLHADTSACYEYLRHCDFGFVHEVLSEERLHPGQLSSEVHRLSAGVLAYLEVLLEYGPIYLSEEEFTSRKKEVFDGYYRDLGRNLLKLKSREFWELHSSRLREIGSEIDWPIIVTAAIKEALGEIRHPGAAMAKLDAYLKQKRS